MDAYSQTSVPNIYAVGDVTNRVNLTPVAIREGHAFADTVYGGKPTPVDHTNVPTAVFSEPEIGVVGLTEAQARERLDKVDVYKTSFPSYEGDPFRPQHAFIHETLGGRDHRSRRGLPHHRTGRGRTDTDRGNCGEDGRIKKRL